MKRRVALVLTTVLVMVVVAAGVALAATINCADQSPGTQGGPCVGTIEADVITGTAFSDDIAAASGADTVDALGSGDDVYGDSGGDTLNGQGSGDYLEGGRGEDTLNGGAANDAINAVDGLGGDVANGGAGDDDCYLDDIAGGPQETPENEFGNDVAENCENIFVLVKVVDTTP
jgi:Ca2+-binding RTX toxin-like protein